MSWITAEAGQDSKDGMTKPTPLPERVGAKGYDMLRAAVS